MMFKAQSSSPLPLFLPACTTLLMCIDTREVVKFTSVAALVFLFLLPAPLWRTALALSPAPASCRRSSTSFLSRFDLGSLEYLRMSPIHSNRGSSVCASLADQRAFCTFTHRLHAARTYIHHFHRMRPAPSSIYFFFCFISHDACLPVSSDCTPPRSNCQSSPTFLLKHPAAATRPCPATLPAGSPCCLLPRYNSPFWCCWSVCTGAYALICSAIL